MKNFSRLYLFCLIGFVILSLIGVQLYWIQHSIVAQKQALDRNLKEDIDAVVKEVEESAHCFTLYSKAYIKKGEGVYIVKQRWDNGRFKGPANDGYVDTLQLYNLFPADGRDSFFYTNRSLSFESYPATVDVTLRFSFIGDWGGVKHDTSAYQVPNLSADNFRGLLANKLKVNEAIDMHLLDTLIKDVLLRNKIDTVYDAGIQMHNADVFEYMRSNALTEHLTHANVKIDFLSNKFNVLYALLLYITDTYSRIIRSLLVMMISSFIIILVLIISYIYFIRTILNQRRLSEMKNAFINNITHEFRTPITNINLAVENWKDNSNSERYIGIIAEENSHMERNVEQILQLAVLEADTKRKHFHKTNINGLIEEAVKSFAIQLQHIDGAIQLNLNAANPQLFCNAPQIRNMLQNLIDNAIKYRSGHPLMLTISTYDTGSHFVLQIEDNGIGMSIDTQKHIFDRFFRGSTGDTHDVKGFGLGMSYVKYIVDAHEGEINIKSKQGKGTRITIYLPRTLETVT